ncbi:MAG: hypothetical protein LBL01_07490, partial [Bifidobacteriaceae bacterium]|nr:hypothetical protein [Bifidobacteriaceae bacterium]
MHQSKDVVALLVAAVGMLAMVGLAAYAHGTTAGVTEDIRSITSPVAKTLNLIVSTLMNIATVVMPAAVVIASLFRRQLRLALQGALAGIAALAAAVAIRWAITAIGWAPLIQGMSGVGGSDPLGIAPLASLAAGALSAMGPRTRRPIMSASWNVLWVALATLVLTGGATLPAAFMAVLVGRAAGMAIRYAMGATTDRATGSALVAGIRGAGLDPVRIVRVRDISESENPTDRLDVRALRESLKNPGTSARRLEAAVSDSTSNALERAGGNRIYAVFDAAGRRWDAIVLDGDRQVLGYLQATWRALRLRGMDRRSVVSLRQAAERAALLGYAAQAAGVRTPKLMGVGEAADSMMLLQAHPDGLRSTEDMRPSEITDAALVDVWRQLRRAHRAGLAHRNITAASILFGRSSPAAGQPADATDPDRAATAGTGADRAGVAGTHATAVAGTGAGREGATAPGATDADATVPVGTSPAATVVAGMDVGRAGAADPVARASAGTPPAVTAPAGTDADGADVGGAGDGIGQRKDGSLDGRRQEVWLIGWEDGDVASSDLARNLDCVQMLAALALKVGPVRAIRAAEDVMPRNTLAALAGLLQPVVFPPETRELARANREVIEATRQELADLVETTGPALPFQLVRFGWRTVLIVAMTLIAVWAVVTRLNFDQMMEAISRADPWWMAL